MWFNDNVKCSSCNHLVEKKDAQKVTFISAMNVFGGHTEWRCSLHKLPFEQFYQYFDGTHHFYQHRTVEVTQEGKPIQHWREVVALSDGTPQKGDDEILRGMGIKGMDNDQEN